MTTTVHTFAIPGFTVEAASKQTTNVWVYYNPNQLPEHHSSKSTNVSYTAVASYVHADN